MSRCGARFGALAVPVFLAALASPRAAVADEPAATSDTAARTAEMDVRKVRSGLVLALGFGYGIAQASGYPNDSSAIGDPNYYSSSNVMLGGSSLIFLGWAMADYLNFGIWFGGGSYKSHDWQARGGGAGFRVEAFPLVYALPKLKGLGAFAQLGIGSTTLQAQNGNYPEAKGAQSFLGIGAMWEFKIFNLFGGHVVAGPSIEYDAIYSSSIGSGAGLIGGRLAFYGGP